VDVPLLNFYSGDDSLVPAFEAKMMAAYEAGTLQRTIELQRGEHAYFFDRWWQRRPCSSLQGAAPCREGHDDRRRRDRERDASGTPASTRPVDLGADTDVGRRSARTVRLRPPGVPGAG
jgi:hypothetical protein